MVKEIVRDPIFLSHPSAEATAEDLQTAQDLADTLIANRERCVGMAANMIGVLRRIIVFYNGDKLELMLNPVIVSSSSPYETEEGCLSLSGLRKTRRFDKIKLQYQTTDFKTRLKTYTGYPAQIIQHELDHCNGVLI